MGKYELKPTGKVVKSTPVAGRLPVIYEVELHRLIEDNAYLRAEKDGFRCSPLDYWLAAEKEVHQYF